MQVLNLFGTKAGSGTPLCLMMHNQIESKQPLFGPSLIIVSQATPFVACETSLITTYLQLVNANSLKFSNFLILTVSPIQCLKYGGAQMGRDNLQMGSNKHSFLTYDLYIAVLQHCTLQQWLL